MPTQRPISIRSTARTVARTVVALALALTLLAGCKKSAGDESDTEAAAVSVQAQHPTVGPIAEEIPADAILAPLAQAAIAPRINAPIRAEYVQRGSRVHKGQLLVTLQDRDLEGNAIDSKGAVTAAAAAYATATQATIPEDLQKAKLDVDQTRANLEVANRTAEERKRLLAQGAIAGREVDTSAAAAVQAQVAYDTAVKHLQSVQNTTRKTNAQAAQGQLTSAQGRLVNAEAQVSFASLRSPIDGVVTDRPLFPGETASAGSAIITVMDTSSLLAKLHIAQSAAQQLKVGGTADVTLPGDDQPETATIALVSPALDPGSTTVEVWLKLPNPGGKFKVGTPVHAILHGNTVPNAVLLPPSAILPSDDGGTSVLTVQPDGTAKKVVVKLGLRTSGKVQILSGVTPSDLVITEGGYGLDDGSKVKVGGAADDDSAKPSADDKGAKD
jgi:multidrug efflux pump subunit AcrA (membrane-fusion protein)